MAEMEYEDLQVWRGEPTREFSVRSAYKLLQETTLDPNELFLHTETINFYRKLWSLQIPSKIKMLLWRISWNYIPSFLNLKIKRVLVNTKCPRCECEEESSRHIFQQYPESLAKETKSSCDSSAADYGTSFTLLTVISRSSKGEKQQFSLMQRLIARRPHRHRGY